MAHVLLVSWGSFGDINPFIGLGRQLRARGHRTTLIANQYFEPIARSEGLDFAPMGSADAYYESSRDPDFWNPQMAGIALTRHVVKSVLQGIRRIEELQGDDTIIIGSRWALAAPIASEKFRLPVYTLLLNLTSLLSVYSPAKLPGVLFPKQLDSSARSQVFDALEQWLAGYLKGPLNKVRAQLGLPPIADLSECWNKSDYLLAAWPDWLYSRQIDWPDRAMTVGFIAYDGPPTDPAKILNLKKFRKRPLVFTAGTAMPHAADFYRAAVGACLFLKRPGILLTRYKEQLPDHLPELVCHMEYYPLNELLSNSAALIHHGGIGTSAAGLRAGIPQVIIPIAHDQFENAQRLTDLGVASTLDRAILSPAMLGLNILAMLNSRSIAAQCLHWAQQMQQQDGTQEVCRLIEEIEIRKPKLKIVS